MLLESAAGQNYITINESNERVTRSFPLKFVAGAAAAAAVLLVGTFANVTSSSLYMVAPRVASIPQTSSVLWAAPESSSAAVDEDDVAAKAVEAAVEEDAKENPKDQFWGDKTYYPKLADTLAVNKKWYIIDATDLRLGRMATEIANILRGKRNPMFHPAMDMGDYVIVVNAEKVIVSGRKAEQKLYRRHGTGRPGSMKVETFNQLQQRIPERIIEHAVKGMLPKGSLGRSLFTHLKVFKGPNHPHEAQQPIEFKFEGALSRAAEPLGRR